MRRSIIFAVALTLLVLAGCGGGSGDSTSTDGSASPGGPAIKTSSLSKAEFIKQAAKACRQEKKKLVSRAVAYVNRQQSKQQRKSSEESGLAGVTQAVVLPAVKMEIADIRKLGAPVGDESEIEAFLNAEQEAVDSLTKLKRITSRVQMERYFAESAKLARAYGLNACANGE